MKMAEDIQSLLDRINAEGVARAEEESGKIIADAKAQAEKIIADAKTQAEVLVKEGADKAAVSEMRAKEAIKQAARDTSISGLAT